MSDSWVYKYEVIMMMMIMIIRCHMLDDYYEDVTKIGWWYYHDDTVDGINALSIDASIYLLFVSGVDATLEREKGDRGDRER